MALLTCRVAIAGREFAELCMGPSLVPLTPYRALAAPG